MIASPSKANERVGMIMHKYMMYFEGRMNSGDVIVELSKSERLKWRNG